MLLLYAVTLFLSATLMFLIQPMFAKIVLPLLGGTPAVWNTCMVFYQTILLAGYVYAHLITTRLSFRQQVLVHLGVLALPILTLPISLTYDSPPPTGTNPIPWLLLALAMSVGLPFFVISTTAPLLQRWFAESGHPEAKDPYFLYGASNLGSLVALLGYPFLVEPRLRIVEQSWGWTVGYGLLALLVVPCAMVVWRTTKSAYSDSTNVAFQNTGNPNYDGEMARDEDVPLVTPGQRLHWIALAFVPSSLLLGVTTYVTTDIASAPLLWVIPLAIYLFTFVLVFARRPWVTHEFWVRAHGFAILPLLILFFLGRAGVAWILLPLHLMVFFLTAMVCHGEFARRRPSAAHLTEFYLCMSFGGMLGGMFNSLVAPLIFPTIVEYPLVLVLGCLLRPDLSQTVRGVADRLWDVVWPLTLAGALLGVTTLATYRSWEFDTTGMILMASLAGIVCYSFRGRPIRFGLGAATILVSGAVQVAAQNQFLMTERSFFGVLRVRSVEEDGRFHQLLHGSTLHGSQSLDEACRREPLTYYHRQGPIGQVFEVFSKEAAKPHVAVIGLGAGTLACYGEPGQHWTFYEIDPAVERIARDTRYFTFLHDCKAKVDVVLGDARLSMAQAPNGHFGIIVLDAFSSDAIPIHLITREAVQGYLEKLADDGVLAFHISNKYLLLHSVVASLAADLGLECRAQGMQINEADSKLGFAPSDWVLLARRAADLGPLANDPRWKPLPSERGTRVWTDDYSNVLRVIRFGEFRSR